MAESDDNRPTIRRPNGRRHQGPRGAVWVDQNEDGTWNIWSEDEGFSLDLDEFEDGCELAPVRVNMISAGFVDTGMSASLLGDRFEARRQDLRGQLSTRGWSPPWDVASLAVHTWPMRPWRAAFSTWTEDSGSFPNGGELRVRAQFGIAVPPNFSGPAQSQSGAVIVDTDSPVSR